MHYLSNPYLSAEDTQRIINLLKLIRAKVVIEFGCQEGRTAWAILHEVPGLEKYVGVDVLPGYKPRLASQRGETPGVPGLFIKRHPKVELVLRAAGSVELAPDDLPLCDAAFIDGDHSREGVLYDTELASSRIRSPGVIIWHDYGNPVTEVKEALDGLIEQGWPIQFIDGTWLAYRLFP